MMDIEEIKKKYQLSEKEFEEMYEKCKYVTFYNCKPQTEPVAVFVGGQTGAGKGGIDVYSQLELKNNSGIAAVLDVDVYRAMHPYTKEILKKYPTIYTDITAQETGKILKRIMQEAIDNNYNFIFEGTLRNNEALNTIRNMPKHYKKYIRVMATSYIESLLTAFERNYQQIEKTGYGRFTNVETHNITYEGVLNTIKEAEEMLDIVTIDIFSRGNDMTSPIKVYTSSQSSEKPSEVLIQYREKDLEKTVIHSKERFEELMKILKPKDEYEINQVRKLKEIIMR